MPLRDETVMAVDLELTGLDPERDRIVEVGIVRGRRGGVIERWSTLVRPGVPMTADAARITGLTDAALEQAPTWDEVSEEVARWLAGAIRVGHRVQLDQVFLDRAFGRALEQATFDTWEMARTVLSLRSHALASVCAALGVPSGRAHRALGDAEATWAAFWAMVDLLDPVGEAGGDALHEALGQLRPNSELRAAQWATVTSALASRRTVWVEYLSANDEGRMVVSEREVAVWWAERPRFSGWCHLREAERVFRLDRVRSVRPGARSYALPSGRGSR